MAPAPNLSIDGEGDEGDPERQQKADRSLGEDRAGPGGPEDQPGPAPVEVARAPRLEGLEGDPYEAAHDSVDLDRPSLVPEEIAGCQDESREYRGPFGGPPASQPQGHCDRTQ